MPQRFFGLAPVEVGCSQWRAREARQRTADCDTFLPLIHRNMHRIHPFELATLHRDMEQPEIPGLMTAEPMAHDINEVRVFAEDNDVRHVVPGSPIVASPDISRRN